MGRMTAFVNKKYFWKWLIYAIVFDLFLVLLCVILDIMDAPSIMKPYLVSLRERGFSEDNIYATQVSATFIIVSLVSFLAGSGEEVLWENTVRYSLVKPVIVNFISLAVFLVNDLIAVTVAYFRNDFCLFWLFFIISLFLLCVMTYKMIGAFFARESIKKQLIHRFSSLDDKQKAEKLDILKDKTLSFIVINQYKYVKENLDFLYRVDAIDILIELLKRISKSNTGEYWKYINEYNLLTHPDIYIISNDLCANLIEKKENIDLCKKLIEMLYNSQILERQIEKLKEQTSKICVGTNGPSGFIDFYKMNVWEIEMVKNHYNGIGGFQREADSQILRKASDLNMTIEGALRECLQIPIPMLIVALCANNIIIFEYLLDYILEVRQRTERLIFEYINETVLLHDNNVDPVFKKMIMVNFLSMEENEKIKKILLKGSDYLALTEVNTNKMISISMTPIQY